MKNFCNALLRLSAVIMLAAAGACAQSTEDAVAVADVTETVNDSSASGAEAFVVNIFPRDFFADGYVETYDISGSDQSAAVYKGTFTIESKVQTIFNGEVAVPVVGTLSYSKEINGVLLAPLVLINTDYFSVAEPRRYLGSKSNNTGIIMLPVDQSPEIPLTVSTETSGSIADLIATDGSVQSIRWSLLAPDADAFALNYFFVISDSAGSIISNEAQTFIIDAAGERSSWAFEVVLPASALTLSFTGTRI